MLGRHFLRWGFLGLHLSMMGIFRMVIDGISLFWGGHATLWEALSRLDE
jgi:hypothetical protein